MCNLLCPQCARVVDGKLNPELHMKRMSINEYKRLLPVHICKQLDHIFFCGNYGDPVVDPLFFDCAEYLVNNGVKLTIYTNGSLRSAKWWEYFATMLGDKGKVVFAIDGLADTNHIYRVNSNFNQVMLNAEYFINAGGNARWDYLIFDHNEHQVEEAKKIASDLGFKTFNEKLTKRFIHNKHYKTNKGSGKFGDIVKKYGSWQNYINKTEISCKYQQGGILYIDFELNLWPCCWLGAPKYFYGHDNMQKDQIYKLIDKYGDGFNSLVDKSIEEVLNHPWYTDDLVKSWSQQMCTGKLMTCGRTCGTEYKFSSGDESNKKEIVL